MATPVYSTMIFELAALPANVWDIGPPPDGHKWIVRDVDAINETGNARALLGFKLWDSVANFAGPQAGSIGPGVPYEWRGRQVIESGVDLKLETFEDGWQVRIAGYALTLP